MFRKQLIVAWAIGLFLFTTSILAEQSVNVAPELQLEEGDFTYGSYKDSLKLIENTIDGYQSNKVYDPKLEMNYIGIPNSLLMLEGYGLFTQREILYLKLDNAKLKAAKKDEMVKLERAIKGIESKIVEFLKINKLVD